MKKLTEKQIALALKQPGHKTPVSYAMCISEHIHFAVERRNTGGLCAMNKLRRLKQREEQNYRLKQMAADFGLDKHVLQEILTKIF